MSAVPPSGSPFAKLIIATSYMIGAPDLGNVLVFTSGSAVAVSLPGPGNGGNFARGEWVELVAAGAGTVTVTPLAQPPSITAPTINGSSSLAISSGSATIFQDLSGNWRAVVAPSAAGGGGITQLTGAVTAGPGSGSQAATIPLAASSLLGNPTGSAAAAEALTLGANLSFNGTAIDVGDAPLVLTGQTSTPGSSAGTLTNAPAVGNPTLWLQISVNGVTYYIPGWT